MTLIGVPISAAILPSIVNNIPSLHLKFVYYVQHLICDIAYTVCVLFALFNQIINLFDEIVTDSPTSLTMADAPLRLSEFEALCVGALGGMCETTLQMPLITWKICVQEHRRYPPTIPEWYRGVFINAGSLAPITAVQCFANSLFQNIIYKFRNVSKLSELQQLGCSAGAGAISAFIYGPVDLMVIQQQKYKAAGQSGELMDTFNQIKSKYGALRIYRGLLSCIVRESIYTMGYLGVAPVVYDRLLDIDPWFGDHKLSSSVLSAWIGGSFAAVLTHPVDTAKTCVQSDLEGIQYTSAMNTGGKLYKEAGVKRLFLGVIPRTLRLCGACFVISQTREAVLKFKKYRLALND